MHIMMLRAKPLLCWRESSCSHVGRKQHDTAPRRYERRAYTDNPRAAGPSKSEGRKQVVAQAGNAAPAGRQHHDQGHRPRVSLAESA